MAPRSGNNQDVSRYSSVTSVVKDSLPQRTQRGDTIMPMRIGTPMPSLEGATEWFNGSAEEALKETEGHPVLVHFWSLSCGMCKENLPRVAEWREQYRAAGLRLIAIHMPRYPADTDLIAV